jgi:Malic enzyme, N-terminal domain
MTPQVSHTLAILPLTLGVSATLTMCSCTRFAGQVYSILKNWPERRIKAICLTDGEQVHRPISDMTTPHAFTAQRGLLSPQQHRAHCSAHPFASCSVTVSRASPARTGMQVGSLGDLGVQAVGLPISKLALYTACGGVEPSVCLPVCIDAGTDNEELLQSPFYVGARYPPDAY